MNIVLKSREAIVRGENAVQFEEAQTPPGILSIREHLGLDYGKLDYVLRDGEVVLFDVNRTPAAATLDRARLTHRVTSHLAPGIWSLLYAAKPARGAAG